MKTYKIYLQKGGNQVYNTSHNNWISQKSALIFGKGFETIEEAVNASKKLKSLSGNTFKTLYVVSLGHKNDFVTMRLHGIINNGILTIKNN
jgi:hypothetical protein